jgi:PAS domain-containing protein
MAISWIDLYSTYAQLLWVGIALLSFLLGISYVVKAYQRHDVTIGLMAIVRFLFALVWLYLALNTVVLREQRVVMKETTIFVMFLADIVSTMVFFITKHYQIDIDMQKAAAHIKKLEDKNHFILEQSPVGIYQYSINTWKFTYVNPEFTKSLGSPEGGFIGRLIFEGMDPADAKRVRDSVLLRLKNDPNEVSVRPIHIKTSEGNVIELLCESRIVFNGEATVLGYARKVS